MFQQRFEKIENGATLVTYGRTAPRSEGTLSHRIVLCWWDKWVVWSQVEREDGTCATTEGDYFPPDHFDRAVERFQYRKGE